MTTDPAVTLRAASEKLRELADLPMCGPWRSWVSDDRRWTFVGEPAAEDGVVARCADDEDAAYIAAMSPPVALALAKLLAEEADFHACLVSHGATGLAEDDLVLAVAAAVLGPGWAFP